ncbi:putative transcriptional regulator, contains C-terminal CBS domains [Metallosphaera yellowstonensis MK1]|jgi:tRNA nucleotidyltransferase (CCA-adding enzyme)|uniref:Putative transcriptional regulator, contains C-terminal CBS domains n=1 Tax=Metallosphaera yellowstonensis MK1 TaxID=671065 RepID=H2C1B1_9CREN|nr:CBS domain-containing protein [Metallosphaera yellowstonensis]EHP70032.1 putative transcriptional regulator, contains C-terminal CBS domains [Metallosphaera yellowstonensis MK1]
MESSTTHLRIRRPLIVTSDVDVRELLKRMEEEGKGIAVVMEDRRPVGIVTRRALERALSRGLKGEVKKIMNELIITITGEEDLLDLLTTMIKNKLECFVVMRRGKLIGVVTVDDLFYSIQKRTYS